MSTKHIFNYKYTNKISLFNIFGLRFVETLFWAGFLQGYKYNPHFVNFAPFTRDNRSSNVLDSINRLD